MAMKARASRVTLNDVALRADVSPVTVSRVLRDPGKVSEALRTRVNAAVRELAYIPNQLASALASRTGHVAVIVPSFTNGVFDDYLRAAHDMLVPAGFQSSSSIRTTRLGAEEKAIATALGQYPEAIILAGIDQTAQAKRSLRQAGIPVVQTMEISPIRFTDINIGLSHFDAGYAAARHLFELGHRHVGHIAAPLNSRARKRVAGYMRAVREFGAAPAVASVDSPSSVALGGSVLAEMMDRAPATTAVFCGNDNLALGVLFECQRQQIRVPVHLRSSDSTTWSSRAAPALR